MEEGVAMDVIMARFEGSAGGFLKMDLTGDGGFCFRGGVLRAVIAD